MKIVPLIHFYSTKSTRTWIFVQNQNKRKRRRRRRKEREDPSSRKIYTKLVIKEVVLEFTS